MATTQSTPIIYRTSDGTRHTARLTTQHGCCPFGQPVVVAENVAYSASHLKRMRMRLLAVDNPVAAAALRQAGYRVLG